MPRARMLRRGPRLVPPAALNGHEFIAAPSDQPVAGTRNLTRDPGHALQTGVSGGVPMALVDTPQVIQLDAGGVRFNTR